MLLHSTNLTAAQTSTVIHGLPRILAPLAALLTFYLYLYPIFHGCVFPSTDGVFETAIRDTLVQHTKNAQINPLDSRPYLAPFRLLVLADPQLEGDSSLPKPEDALANRTAQHWSRLTSSNSTNSTSIVGELKEISTELFLQDIPNALKAIRKRVDLFGNDYYLAHIFRTLHWWTKPTHVTVLGDLIGSQWVDDDEFEWRGWRYWNRVLAGGERVSDGIMELGKQGSGISMQMDDSSWSRKIINIAGNHDIGYAGDITQKRMDRFEEMYGKANWDLRFNYPASRLNTTIDGKALTPPTLHLIVLNSMLLDTPAMEEHLQSATYAYINDVISNRMRSVDDRTDFTLLLTHVPMYKKEGVCVDGPLFQFWGEDDNAKEDVLLGGLKEQNHLSDFASHKGVLASIFGMSGNLDNPAQGRGRPGLVLTGHDHEGCDVWHYIPQNTTAHSSQRMEGEEQEGEKETVWDATRWKDADKPSAHTGVREVTLRSMMGEFGGNAGLMSAWFDFEKGEWQYDIQMCRLGIQHIWWAIHVIDLLAVASLATSIVWKIQTRRQSSQKLSGDKSMKIE